MGQGVIAGDLPQKPSPLASARSVAGWSRGLAPAAGADPALCVPPQGTVPGREQQPGAAMAEALRTLNADLLAIRGALEAGSPAGTLAAALREKLAQEFLAAVHGFHARFAQCRRMRAGGPAPGGLRGPRLLGLHRLHPGADALSLGGRAVVPGLAPQGRWLRENPHLLLPAGAGGWGPGSAP